MIYSMTGYGRARCALNGREITVELRGVNSRYLDISIKLHRSYTFAEDKIKAYLQSRVSRGKLDVYITVDAKSSDTAEIVLNEDILRSYLSIFSRMEKEYGIKDDLTVTAAASLPDVLTKVHPEVDTEQLSGDILEVVRLAADSFNEMRRKEGEALLRDVRSQIARVTELVSLVEERLPRIVEEYRKRLEQKLSEILEGRGIDESRIITEAALFADRVDVNEETVRLRSHVAQMEDMLEKGGAVGRKLDFLLQEMNRETNTIGSKGNDLQMSGLVVELKSVLEKIREQIANIE